MRGGATRVFLSRWAASGYDARATSWLEVFTVDVRERTVDSGLQGALVTTVCLSLLFCTPVLTDSAEHWANDVTDDDGVILIGDSPAPRHRRD